MSAPRKYECQGPLAAGMVPHHLLASDMIAGFFSLAARYRDNYDTILLVSTSHFPQDCGSDVVTAMASWDTPYGKVQADTRMVETLLQNSILAAEDNPAAVEFDHGVAGLVPFVKYYLPQVKVAACLLSNQLSQEKLEELMREVNALLAGGRVLLVASVDCSHYLMPEEAAKHDSQTAQAIEDMDFACIRGFTDSNVDSPQSVAVFLSAVQSGSLALEQLDHSGSADKLPHAISNPIYSDGITTYFVYAASR